VEADPTSNVDLSVIHISDSSGGSDIQLTDATVTHDLIITLTEAQRNTVILISDTNGSDGGNTTSLQITSGAFQDVARPIGKIC
jgi:hypothetical protein